MSEYLNMEPRIKVNHSVFRKIMGPLYVHRGWLIFAVYIASAVTAFMLFPLTKVSPDPWSLVLIPVGLCALNAFIIPGICAYMFWLPCSWLGKKFIIRGYDSLLRISGGKVVEVAENTLWRTDLKPGDENHDVCTEVPADYFGCKGFAIAGENNGILAKVFFCIKPLYKEHPPVVSWQHLYDTVVKAGHSHFVDYFKAKLHEQIEAHRAEYAPIFTEYLQEKIGAADLLRQLAKVIATWQIIPEFPGLPIWIELLREITVEHPDGTAPVEYNELNCMVSVSIAGERK